VADVIVAEVVQDGVRLVPHLLLIHIAKPDKNKRIMSRDSPLGQDEVRLVPHNSHLLLFHLTKPVKIKRIM
jgi:hypothetical protein